MKGRFSIVGARLLLGAFLTPDAVAPPEEMYLALCLRPPTDADSGSTLSEPPLGSGYSRAPVPIGQAHWVTSGYGTFWNSEPIIFPPAQDTWQRTRAFAVCTAPSSGDIVAMGRTSLGNIPSGYQLVVAVGELQIVLRGTSL